MKAFRQSDGRHVCIGRYFASAKVAKATKSPTSRDLEWAAGFLEGEGSFLYNHNRKTLSNGRKKDTGTQEVSATQVHTSEPLNKLQALFGGTVRGEDWRVTGPRARGVMMTLYPLVSSRRKEQIRRALSEL